MVKTAGPRLIGLLLCLGAAAVFADPADADSFQITGGIPLSSIPQGNNVLGQAGIAIADGQIWKDATLRNDGTIPFALYDVGSESGWKIQIQMLNAATGATVWDNDDHGAGGSGTFVNGSAPFQLVKSFSQASGTTNIRFWRITPEPKLKAVVNGQSPAAVPGFGTASIAFAYLDETYQIVSGPTNRILVLLEDGKDFDDDYDDYVAIVDGPPVGPPPPPPPATLSISGGTQQLTTIPQGNSGNSVLAEAGIGFAGGKIWVDGVLDILGTGATLTLYDVGSESHWINELHLGNDSGTDVRDWDDHFRDSSATSFTNGPAPFQYAGTVTQGSGVADFEFRRVNPTPEYQTVVNGQSPMMNVPDYGFASIALAYLNGANQIVEGPTDRVLVMLEDGGTDRDYDDYVGILSVITGPPPSYPVAPNFLNFGGVPRNTNSPALSVTVTNASSGPLSIGSITVTGGNASQFTKTNHCPSSLSSGNNCTVSVVLKPNSKGDKYGNLNLTVGGKLRVVGLYGNGT
jgi:hypothetical protein